MPERPGLVAAIKSPLWAHVAPFVAWLLLMQLLGEPAAWKYAVRSAVCLALFAYLRPWRHYEGLRSGNIPLALLAGIAVFLVWNGE